MYVECVVIAEEIKEKNPEILITHFFAQLQQLKVIRVNQMQVEFVSHETFKNLPSRSVAYCSYWRMLFRLLSMSFYDLCFTFGLG